MNNEKRRKTILLCAGIAAIILLIRYSITIENSQAFTNKPLISYLKVSANKIRWASALSCYGAEGNVAPELASSEPIAGQSIFFHLTSCPASGDMELIPRQACAIESAALFHPEKDVYLLVVAPIKLELNQTRNEVVRALLNYTNIKIRHINFERYTEETPMNQVVAKLQKSSYPVPHASDVLRYTTLYKFKGLYLDLDVLLIRRMPDHNNYVGAESRLSLGAGVIQFGADEIGVDMGKQCADELSRTFDGKDWGNNGPGVITRVLHRRCHTKTTLELWGKVCNGFQVRPPSSFYALPFETPKLFFEENAMANVVEKLEHSFLVHYWNKVTSKLKASKPGVPFYEFARKNCPLVFKAVKGNF